MYIYAWIEICILLDISIYRHYYIYTYICVYRYYYTYTCIYIYVVPYISISIDADISPLLSHFPPAPSRMTCL